MEHQTLLVGVANGYVVEPTRPKKRNLSILGAVIRPRRPTCSSDVCRYKSPNPPLQPLCVFPLSAGLKPCRS